ncbi:MAG: hypothetical protein CMJ19_20845 [Phycisphaeraceae bacterium]|nr:hypothetical protein [Phycisphaeraceae bacterium]
MSNNLFQISVNKNIEIKNIAIVIDIAILPVYHHVDHLGADHARVFERIGVVISGLCRKSRGVLLAVVCGLLAQQSAYASDKTILCDSFDNGRIQDAGNGHTSYWRPSGQVTEADGKAVLHASGRPYSKTALSSPAEKRISFFHQPVTASIDNIALKANDGADITKSQLRFGFRNANLWTFRNTVDALIVNIKNHENLTVAWKVGQKKLDPEAGNKLLITKLDTAHGPVTGVSFTADGRGKTINWKLTVIQADHQSDFHGVIGELDTQTIKSGWRADDHAAVVTAEVQTFLGELSQTASVDLFIDQMCIKNENE